MSANFVDPSTLSLPSPQSDVPDSPRSEHLDNTAGPSRKRARTDMSAEERKEARAHRNRIAAQNSRDRRKAQFTALERRVAELEEENRQLRAGMTLSDLQHADIRRAQEQEREKARERENAELKERIKSLEKGWEAVMKVLAAQGLPTPSSSAESTTSSSNESTPPSSSNNTTTTFPVLVPSAPVFPITPSPSISGASIVLDTDESESTRHLAAGGLPTLESTFAHSASSLIEAELAPTPLAYDAAASSPANEAAVDAWIREIFSGSPVNAPASSLPECDTFGEEPAIPSSAATPTIEAPLIGMPEITSEWENGVEMQRLLELFTTIQPDGDVDVLADTTTQAGDDVSTALGLELCGGWNVEREAVPTSSGVGVF